MSSLFLSVGKFEMNEMFSYFLLVDMEFDNRKNAQHAIINKICRDLLEICDKDEGVLANPEKDQTTIHLIARCQILNGETMKKFMKDQRIFVKFSQKCSPFDIEKCIHFTIFHKLEKVKWFRIGNDFVQDGFLSWKYTNIPKITLNFHCLSNGELTMKITAERIRLFPFESWMFDENERFNKMDGNTKNVNSRWVTCLPKLGKGRIVRIHRKVPDNDSPFKSYEQIRNYWKVTYGYILPTEEPCVYYDIVFYNGEKMLYPFYCVLTSSPEVIKLDRNCLDHREALSLFLNDFKTAKIQICGINLKAVETNNRSVKNYLDVTSLISSKKAKSIEKMKRKRKTEESEEISSVWKSPKKICPI